MAFLRWTADRRQLKARLVHTFVNARRWCFPQLPHMLEAALIYGTLVTLIVCHLACYQCLDSKQEATLLEFIRRGRLSPRDAGLP